MDLYNSIPRDKYCSKCGRPYTYCKECGDEIHFCSDNSDLIIHVSFHTCSSKTQFEYFLPESDRYCSKCGVKYSEPYYCTECGEKIYPKHECYDKNKILFINSYLEKKDGHKCRG